MNSFRIGMNSFRIKLSKGTILPFSFLLQLPLGNWKLCFLILSLHKKFYFLTIFTSQNSSIYPEWFHSGSEWIHSVPEWTHSNTGFFIVLKKLGFLARDYLVSSENKVWNLFFKIFHLNLPLVVVGPPSIIVGRILNWLSHRVQWRKVHILS